MAQKTEWIKQDDFTYHFTHNGQKAGEMKINMNSLHTTANCLINESRFEIKRKGFWKTAIEITNEYGDVVLSASPEKWYASSHRIDYGNRNFKLIVRNNPLAEFVLTENEKEILAYGLNTENKKLVVKISEAENGDVLLHYLLWYLFVPVANENFGSDYAFLLTAV